MKIVDYKMFNMTEKNPKELIAQGWQPFGSPYIDEEGYDCQAMVKYEQFKLSPGKFAPIDEQESHSFLNEVIQENAKLQEENEQLKKENLLLKEVSKPRDKALLSSIDTIEMLDRIIYAFVANNYRYDEEEGYWIVLNNNTFECNDTARNSFVKIINQIKEKYKNENNNTN